MISPRVSAGPVKELWSARHSRGEESGLAVGVDAGGNVIVTGLLSKLGKITDSYTAKYAAENGARLWERRNSTPDSRVADYIYSSKSVAIDSRGNVLVTTSFANNYNSPFSTSYTFSTVKYAAADGAVVWERRFDDSWSAALVAVDKADNVIVAGRYSAQSAASVVDKYAGGDGTLLWEKRIPRSYTQAMTVDDAGNVIIVGGSTDNYVGFHENVITAKLAGADGRPVWLHFKRYPNKIPTSVVADSGGNVAVTGYIEEAACDDELCVPYASAFHTARYSARGRRLWERNYTDGKRPEDVSGTVAVDSTGNVIVTGFIGELFGGGSYTAKYAASDGTVLWKRSLASPIYFQRALAVEDSDNIVIGSAIEVGNETAFLTEKFAPDGTLVWRKRFDGRTNGPSGIAVGPGLVVITGSSYAPDATWKHVTVKYVDAATPQTLAAGRISPTDAMLHSSVNPNGFATQVGFEYGTDPLLGTPAATAPVAIGQGTAAVPVSAPLVPLVPATTYYYRAVGYANGNITRGRTLSFTTAPSARHLPPTTSGSSTSGRPTPLPAHVR